MNRRNYFYVVGLVLLMIIGASIISCREQHHEEVPIAQAPPSHTPTEPEANPIPENRPHFPELPDVTPEPDRPNVPDVPEIEEPDYYPEVEEPEEKPYIPQPDPELEVEVPPVGNFDLDVANIVHRLVNEERAKHGLQPLGKNSALENVAYRKSVNMGTLGYFSHTAPDGTNTNDWLRADGHNFRTWGENIANHFDRGGAEATAIGIMDAWMNSSGHRANILRDSFDLLGVGVYSINGRVFATQVFGA